MNVNGRASKLESCKFSAVPELIPVKVLESFIKNNMNWGNFELSYDIEIPETYEDEVHRLLKPLPVHVNIEPYDVDWAYYDTDDSSSSSSDSDDGS